MISSPLQATRGTLLRVDSGRIVFHPLDTNYEFHLESAAELPARGKVHGRVHIQARKVYGVPSGGNFVQPILGTPRIIQGRVLELNEKALVVKAGAIFVVELPTGLDTIDLHHGPIGVNSLVNVVALPGASFERVA